MSKGSDAKYFSSQKKGELQELRADLNSTDTSKIKDAVKKVIANMTVGKDVSPLFTDVIRIVQTDIELKKLVYLYIINYARSQPDKAILVVSSFQKDSRDPNPLIRALAVRTMGCIRVDRITQFLCDPLALCLKDKDPYVRKTAAIAVAKLYDTNPELAEAQGFLDTLRDLVSDSNHTVVANAVAALVEISEASGKDVFQMNSDMLAKLLTALDACAEWGQVSILDCLARYTPDAKDALEIVERVAPRLKHANSAVSMSAIKVIMRYLDLIEDPEVEHVLVTQKLAPPLITLLSERKPEIQYVALRNIRLIVQKRPEILANAVKHFFCKYSDPVYVKVEKLEIMISLASVDNIEKVLLEFKEYASEADVDFVRRAVLAIGRCAIKLPDAADKCVAILLGLIDNKVNYVVQESVVVIKDIFRKYPNKYETVIATLCENLERLDEPEAKAAMIWIVGEYAKRIDNAAEYLEAWAENFDDEPAAVQLQLVTAAVKYFLQTEGQGKELVTKLLEHATKSSDNPDLRDRGFVYWRLLFSNPTAALRVVLAEKPPITDDTYQLDPVVLDTLIANISTLASVYHKPPEAFVKDLRGNVQLRSADGKDEEEEEVEGAEGDGMGDENPDGDGESEQKETDGPAGAGAPVGVGNTAAVNNAAANLEELLGLGALGGPAGGASSSSSSSTSASSNVLDIFGFGGAASPAPAPAPAKQEDPVVLTAERGAGLQIRCRAARQGGQPVFLLTLENKSGAAIADPPMRFNDNYLALTPLRKTLGASLAPGETKTLALPLSWEGQPTLNGKAKHHTGLQQVALKMPSGPVYFQDTMPYQFLFEEKNILPKDQWLAQYPKLEIETVLPPFACALPLATIIERLKPFNLVHLATRHIANAGTQGDHMFFSARWRHADALTDVTAHEGSVVVRVKSTDPEVAACAAAAIQNVLNA